MNREKSKNIDGQDWFDWKGPLSAAETAPDATDLPDPADSTEHYGAYTASWIKTNGYDILFVDVQLGTQTTSVTLQPYFYSKGGVKIADGPSITLTTSERKTFILNHSDYYAVQLTGISGAVKAATFKAALANPDQCGDGGCG